MGDETGITVLERRINELNAALDSMKEATSEAHSVLKQMREERRTIEKLLKGDDIVLMIKNRVDDVVKTTLDEIGPTIRNQTNLIYQKVGEQIDKMIDLSLGEEFAIEHNRLSIRPQLAAKLKVWLREVIDKEGYDGFSKNRVDL